MKRWERRPEVRRARRRGSIYVPSDLLKYERLTKRERKALDAGDWDDAVFLVARRLDVRPGWVSAFLRDHKPVDLASLPVGVDSISLLTRGERIVVSASVGGRTFEVISTFAGRINVNISEIVTAMGIRASVHRAVDGCDERPVGEKYKACTKRNHV